MREETVDVLVAGGGGAGLRAAIAAKESAPQLRVVLCVKGVLGEAGVTATACSDRMAFHATLPYTEPGGEDNWKYHADDVYRIGGRVSDGRLAAVQARGAGEAYEYLDKLGVPFAKTADGRADQFVTDGSKYARACYVGPTTAVEIEKALVPRAREVGVEVWENAALVGVLKGDAGECAGGLIVRGHEERKDDEGFENEPVRVAASAVVMATGGPGRAFGTSVFPEGMTAEAEAAALEAGAELVNLEFIQIGLCNPQTRLACSGTMMRALPRMVDESGEEFLPDLLPGKSAAERQELVLRKGASWPVSLEEPSHAIDVACARARAAEDGKGRIFLDFSRDPEGFDGEKFMADIKGWPLEAKGLEEGGEAVLATPFARLEVMNPKVVAWFKERDIDIASGDRVEIAPSVQHFQGGIHIDERAETRVPGLFACGEAAGGQHGANRPGGNALMDSQVFGRVAGESAAERASGRTAAPDEGFRAAARELAARLGGVPRGECDRVCGEVARLLDRSCGVVRTGSALDEAREALEALRSSLAPGKSEDAKLVGAAEALGAVDFALALVESVAARTESRGPHLRFASADSPGPVPRDDSAPTEWTLISKEDGKLVLRCGVPPGLPFEMPK
ncbi:MAG: FAD-binding protein [Planctomycetota bacterium]|jgi:succinate dehydrogenase / fumarate reductase flavoprotein subunit